MQQPRRTSIAIIGGGIGGLTAAACTVRAGFDVHVYGQTQTREASPGINIRPNGAFCIGSGSASGSLSSDPFTMRGLNAT
jgi:glycine/D-amino acid oxidase-like deaminating enzyme